MHDVRSAIREPWNDYLYPALGSAWGMHLIWEFAQSPFFHEPGLPVSAIVWSRFHCSLSDTAIQASAFLFTALLFRRPEGPHAPGLLPRVVFIILGVGFTAIGEIYHVGWVGTWAYSPAMPRIPYLGIGWIPVLQWVMIPTVWWAFLRSKARRVDWSQVKSRSTWTRTYTLGLLALILSILLWPYLIPMYGRTRPVP